MYTFQESKDIDFDYQQLKNKGVQFIKKPETQPWVSGRHILPIGWKYMGDTTVG